MIGGSILAAANDLSFDLQGYLAVMLSNVFTALNGVVMKGTVQVNAMRCSDWRSYALERDSGPIRTAVSN